MQRKPAKNKGKFLMSNIPIFLSSDNNYAPFVATTIASICDNTESFCDFYILDSGISGENKEKICSLKQNFKNFSIEFLNSNSDEYFRSFGYYNAENYITISTYNRFLIPKLKPELNKILYLDVDIVVFGDIAELYNQDLEGYALGAVWDKSRKYYNLDTKELMELSEDYRYFNAGVLLIDIQKWNKDNIADKLFEIADRYGEKVLHADETLLNKYFDGQYKILDLKYNYLEYDLISHPQEQVIIRHFATKFKPWTIPPGKSTKQMYGADEFWKYAEKTAFYKDILENFRGSALTINQYRLSQIYLKNRYKKISLQDRASVYFISVVNDYNLYDKYVKNNKYVNMIENVKLIDFDNTITNKYISLRYNEFLNSYDYSKEAWFIFCHSDWELNTDITSLLSGFDKNKIYGPIGCQGDFDITVKGKYSRIYKGECMEISRDGSQQRKTSFCSFKDPLVDTLDCQAMLVHSSLINKYNLRFDENLKWDLYIEDFCINSYLKYNIETNVIKIKCCHHSDAGFRIPPDSYYEMLEYMKEKYPDKIFAGTCSAIGGKNYPQASREEILIANLHKNIKGKSNAKSFSNNTCI